MDEEDKKQFKMKFYFLAVQLNAIVVFIALSVVFFSIGPGQYRIPLAVLCILIAIALGKFFGNNYRVTKAWLDEHSGNGKNTESGTSGRLEQHAEKDEGRD